MEGGDGGGTEGDPDSRVSSKAKNKKRKKKKKTKKKEGEVVNKGGRPKGGRTTGVAAAIESMNGIDLDAEELADL